MTTLGLTPSSSSTIASRPARTIRFRIMILARTIGAKKVKGVGIAGAAIVNPIIVTILTSTTVATITAADAERTVEGAGAGAGAGAAPGPLLTPSRAAGILTAVRRVAGSPNEAPPLLLKRTGGSSLLAGELNSAVTPNDGTAQGIQTWFKLVELSTGVT